MVFKQYQTFYLLLLNWAPWATSVSPAISTSGNCQRLTCASIASQQYLLIILQSTMSASQDRVQSILETLLEQSLPLVHKGVFTSEQLQASMCEREKMQNNMLKPTYKLSDYLKAIEFQYSLERIRRNKVENLSVTNPLFKKQSKTDFIIIRRIIKLWERTVFKFKYNVDLWKQYLDFCIKANSKNQFYKALSSALRFLPFCEDLWLIGVQYEVEIGLNFWKARKIFIKCLKMNPTKANLWLEMFKFQMRFLAVLYQRQQAIEGAETMQFVMHNETEQDHQDHQIQLENNQNEGQNQQAQKLSDIKLDEHDDILLIVYQEAMSKIEDSFKANFKNSIIRELKAAIKSQKIKNVINVLKKALKRIEESKLGENANLAKKQQKQAFKHQNLQASTVEQKQQYYEQYLAENPSLPTADIDRIVCEFLTKPQYLTRLFTHMLTLHPQYYLTYLTKTKKFKPYNLPSQALKSIVEQLSDRLNDPIYQALYKTIITNINPNKYIECLALMENTIKTNKKLKNYKVNNDIYRSISVLCKKQPEIVQRCLTWIHDKVQE